MTLRFLLDCQAKLDPIYPPLREEPLKFTEIVNQAIVEAGRAQTTVRKISEVLDKIGADTPRPVLQESLQEVSNHVESQVRTGTNVIAACSEQRGRLRKLRDQAVAVEEELKAELRLVGDTRRKGTEGTTSLNHLMRALTAKSFQRRYKC